MAEISQIKLPSGNTYTLKDEVARNLIQGGLKFKVVWDGTATPVVANIPAGVVVKYNGNNYTGTLEVASAEAMTFYLVKSSKANSVDAYEEYVVAENGNTKTWEKLGDVDIDLSTLGNLAYKNSVALNKGTGDVVLGEATTFTAPSASVSFSGQASDSVLGADTTFAVTQPTINVSPTNRYIKAAASGTAVGADGTAQAITDLGTASTEEVTKSVTPTSQKLVTTSITPTNGTVSVSSVSRTTSKLNTTTIPNVTNAGSASTWGFSMGTGSEAETLIISGANGNAPTLGTAITAATGAVSSSGGGATIVTGVTITAQTVAKAGTAVTVATGSTSGTGTGASVVTAVASDGVSVVKELGTATKETVLTGVKVTTQPTVSLSAQTSSATGTVQVMTGASATATGTAVSANTNDKVTAITNVGTASTESKSVTVGTNDKVTVAKHGDLSVTVS